jgi:hypothetical protein
MNILVTGGNGYVGRKFELGGFAISYRVSGDYDMFARAVGKAKFRRLARPGRLLPANRIEQQRHQHATCARRKCPHLREARTQSQLERQMLSAVEGLVQRPQPGLAAVEDHGTWASRVEYQKTVFVHGHFDAERQNSGTTQGGEVECSDHT